jgi:hypothetical protein
LLIGASALALAANAAPAKAFDTVDWTWNLTVTETVDKYVDIDLDIDPDNVVILENLQVFIGDLAATSYVFNVYNNQPVDAGGSTTVDLGELDLTAQYGLGGGFLLPAVCVASNPDITCTITDGNVDETDIPPNVNGTVTAGVDLGELTVEFEPTGSFDALTELPEVVSAATAVANNSSITSDVAIEMHEGQFVFNIADDPEGLGTGGGYADLGNSNLEIALALGLAAGAGIIDPAQITAVSWVDNIVNATVDSSATAVANNKSITIESANLENHLLMADIVQFAYADVAAASTVTNVSVSNYTNLGSLDRPLVNSAATAVGNNLSISVGVPAPAVP